MVLPSDFSHDSDTQPTQIIDFVLGGEADSALQRPRDRKANDVSCLEGKYDAKNSRAISTKEFSVDSMAPPARNSAPRYHFHGLAESQSENSRECPENSDSQKENAPASNESSKHSLNSQNVQPSQRSHSKEHFAFRSAVSGVRSNIDSNAVGLTQPRPSTQAKNAMISSSAMTRQRRSPSTDSFGGPISQDPEQEFLASTKQFNVPLSDLGKPSTMDTSAKKPDNSSHVEEMSFLTAARLAYAAQKSGDASRTNRLSDTVLVASTPTNSDHSQALSDDSHGDALPRKRSLFDGFPTYEEKNHSQESEPSLPSSYDRLLANELSQDEEQAIPDISTFPATQPTSEVDETLPSDLTGVQTTGPSGKPSDKAPTDLTAHTKLLALIDPTKRWRYTRGLQMQVENEKRAPTQSEVIQETQPSHARSGEKGVLSPVVSHHGDAARPVNRPNVARSSRIWDDQDAMEIIPDSEASHDQGASPRHSNVTGTVDFQPASRGLHPALSPIREPDSVSPPDATQATDEDGDEDVPLATILAGGREHVNKSADRHSRADSRTLRHHANMHVVTSPSKNKKDEVASIMDNGVCLDRKDNPSAHSAIRAAQTHSSDTGEVPTSAPEQDLLPRHGQSTPMVDHSKSKLAGRRQIPRSIESRTSSRRLRSESVTSAVTKRRRLHADQESEEFLPGMLVDREEEEGTELADDNDTNVNALEGSSDWVPSRKVRPLKTAHRGSNQSITPAPSKRARRLQSATSANTTSAEAPTRVFALWKQDGHYYSGTVYAPHSSLTTRYIVKFDDDTDDIVDISRMRRCELRVGDNVILVDGELKGTVVQVDKQTTDGIVRVEVHDGADVKHVSANMRDIRIAGRTFISQWKDRILHADSIVTLCRPKVLKPTPSTSKTSIVSTPSVRNIRKYLSKTGFVVTLSAKNEHPERERDEVMLAIKNNGGEVIDDWSAVISMNGQHSQSNRCWIASQDDIQWESTTFERVFLLSDDASQKPKFLIALAMGIPCLSVDWLTKSPMKAPEKDWQPYLLPAGFSESLNARISQLVDLDWGNSIEHLTDIKDNLVAAKVFAGKSILCLGSEFVPAPRTKKAAADPTKDTSRTVPRIILAMGAARVEAAHEAKYVSTGNLATYDYVVVKESGIDEGLSRHGGTYVHVPWVKDCLIAGRLLPLPKW